MEEHRFLTNAKKRIDKDLIIYQNCKTQRRQEKDRIKELESEIEALEQAQQIINETAEQVQQKIHNSISAIVTKCLKTVFGSEAYDFEISCRKKRGKTEALLVFCRDGEDVDPLEAAGGGVVDIASFALRLACVLSSIPKLRRLIVLDEPFRHLAIELRPIALQLLQELAKELSVQFIIVSHFAEAEQMKIGKVIKI